MNRRTALVGSAAPLAATTALGGVRARQAGLVLRDGQPFQPRAEAWTLPHCEPSSNVAAAVLASNRHDAQPWIIRLPGGGVEVPADTERHRGSFDPFRREMWPGLGADVEPVTPAQDGRPERCPAAGKPAPQDGGPRPAARPRRRLGGAARRPCGWGRAGDFRLPP